MKFTTIITFLAAFIAVAHGAPDWTAVERMLKEVDSVFQDAVKEVSEIAKKDDAAAGAEIEKTLLAKGAELKAVVDKTFTDVKNQSLTAEKVKEYMQEGAKIFTEGRQQIKGDFRKLSGSGRKKIFGVFFRAILECGKRANEIYNDLRK